MLSKFNSPKDYEKRVIELTLSKPRYNDTIPENFIKKLENNHASANDLDSDGLCRRNPLVIALGDSVTAGAFEGSAGLPEEMIQKYFQGESIESIIDIENVYHEKFRRKLGNKYAAVAVSMINAGIGGDNVVGMNTRLQRDVLRYDPDLVIINAVLNGPDDIMVYEKNYRLMVKRIKENTNADVIVMTPNKVIPDFEGNIANRVDLVKRIAIENHFSIADTYAVWESFASNGIELEKMLSNNINHPTILGHEVYALELMKLFMKEAVSE